MPLMDKIRLNLNRELDGILIIAIIFTLLTIQNFEKPTFAELEPNDLILTENDVYYITNQTLQLNGSILISGNATLYIENAKIIIGSYNITLTNAKNGKPKLIIINSTLTSSTPYEIYAYANSSITVDGSTIQRAKVSANDLSEIFFERSKISSQFKVSQSALVSISSSNFEKSRRFTPRIDCYGESRISIQNTQCNFAIYVRGYDSSSIMMKDCIAKWTIQMRQNSKLSLKGKQLNGKIEFYDSSKGTINNVELIENIYAHNSSSVTVTDTKVTKRLRVSDFAVLALNKTHIYFNFAGLEEKELSGLVLYDHAKVTATMSNFEVARIFDSSTLTAIDTELNRVTAYNYSTFIVNGKTDLLNCSFRDFSYVHIMDTNAEKTTRIVALDNSQVWITESSFTGRLIADNFATIYVSDSVLPWTEVRDEAEIFVKNSKIEPYFGVSDKSNINIYGTEIKLMVTRDYSNSVIASKSSIMFLKILDNSEIKIEDSKIEEITIYFKSIEANFSNLSPKKIEKWDLRIDSSVIIFEDSSCPQVSFKNVEIIKAWNIMVSGNSSLRFTDCMFNSFEASGNSVVKFYNTTTEYRLIKEAAQAQVYWYLDITAQNGTVISVVDQDGKEVSSANVTNNHVRIILLETILNGSGSILKNEYIVKISYNGRTQQHNVLLTSNVAFDLTMVPWWLANLHIIISIIGIVVFVVFLIYLGARRIKTKKAQI